MGGSSVYVTLHKFSTVTIVDAALPEHLYDRHARASAKHLMMSCVLSPVCHAVQISRYIFARSTQLLGIAQVTRFVHISKSNLARIHPESAIAHARA